MADLIFYGSSDDLVEVDGVVYDEFPSDDAVFLVNGPDARAARVRVANGRNGCWEVTYAMEDEDVPAFQGRIEAAGYSVKLTLDVPEGTRVHRLRDEERT